MKAVVNNSTVWDLELKEVVKDTFCEIAGGDSTIDIIEFEKWLNRGWLKEKAKVLDNTATIEIARAHESTGKAASVAVSAVSMLSQASGDDGIEVLID